MNGISELVNEIEQYGRYQPEYYHKMVHRIPVAQSVHREKFILEKCLDKKVLHIGCGGFLHKGIEEAAKEAWGIDREGNDAKNFIQLDIEKDEFRTRMLAQSFYKQFDIVLCGEVLEHLSNPGQFLEALKIFECPILISVPNAFSKVGFDHIVKETENVNKEHVAYYSYRTLKTLIERYGYEIKEFHWYNGVPLIAEGLIFVIQGERS